MFLQVQVTQDISYQIATFIASCIIHVTSQVLRFLIYNLSAQYTGFSTQIEFEEWKCNVSAASGRALPGDYGS